MRKQNQPEALLDQLGYCLCKEKKKEEKDAENYSDIRGNGKNRKK